MSCWNLRQQLESFSEELYIILNVYVIVNICYLNMFNTKWDISPSGHFQLWCLSCFLLCSCLALTSGIRTIWKEDCSSRLEAMTFSAYEASMFVKGLMHPLRT